MSRPLFIFIFATFSLQAVLPRQVYDNDRQWYQEFGNPGVKMRLTKKGLEHLREVGVKVLNKEIPKLKGITATANFGGAGAITFKDIEVTSWRPAVLTVLNTKPPDSMVFGLENADVGLKGEFLGKQGAFEVPGDVEGTAKGITMAMTVTLGKNEKNEVTATLSSCKAVMQAADFHVEPRGPLAGFVKQHLQSVNGAIRSYMPSVLCQIISGMVEKAGTGLLNKLTRIDFEEEADTEDLAGEQLSFVQRLTRGAYMDNTLLTDPIVTEDYIETWHAGEIRYNGSTLRTPFFPSPMPDFGGQDKMLYMLANEYILNSMIYHAYHNDRLVLRLTGADLPADYSQFLDTTCEEEGEEEDDDDDDDDDAEYDEYDEDEDDDELFKNVCLGSLIPSLGETYPEQTTEIIVLPHGLPEFAFSEGGRAVMYGKGRMLTYAKDNGKKKPVTVTAADSQSEIIPYVEDNVIKADLKITDMKFKLHRSSIKGIDPENVEQLAPVVKSILGPELGSALKEGLPFPGEGLINLIEPDVIIKEAFARAETDFFIDEAQAQDIAHEAIDGGLRGLGA